jgi:diguanylate cyclase (GGDEF)-like protein
MIENFNLIDTKQDFEEKVSVIADEVLSILKELHRENRQQISSKLIAEKMVWRAPVKNLLSTSEKNKSADGFDSRYIKEFSYTLHDKLKNLLPTSMTDKLNEVKDSVHIGNIANNSKDWLESPINIIKTHMDSITSRNKELEEFVVIAMRNLTETEVQLTSELSSQKDKFKEDRSFTDQITENMNTMSDDIKVSDNIKSIKYVLMDKIVNINFRISKKRDDDMKRLKETENTIEAMSTRLIEIKQEAEEIRRRSKEIEVEVITDALTGLYNRKGHDEKISETIAHVDRYNIKASFILCDIDYFKKINDNFGHKVGDLALKKLATLLKERLRTNDFISRYGGEEFAVILPHTDLEGATKAGNGLREFIDDTVFSYKDTQIPLTISIGVSEFRKGDDHSTVFERADHALYLAKKSGRNTVRTENDVVNSEMVLNNADAIPVSD